MEEERGKRRSEEGLHEEGKGGKEGEREGTGERGRREGDIEHTQTSSLSKLHSYGVPLPLEPPVCLVDPAHFQHLLLVEQRVHLLAGVVHIGHALNLVAVVHGAKNRTVTTPIKYRGTSLSDLVD